MVYRAKDVVFDIFCHRSPVQKSIFYDFKMGNCASNVNCTKSPETFRPTESDPDIAGIGVLVSFGATAVITFIAIVIGYLTDSLPDSTLTELDRACKHSAFMSNLSCLVNSKSAVIERVRTYL